MISKTPRPTPSRPHRPGGHIEGGPIPPDCMPSVERIMRAVGAIEEIEADELNEWERERLVARAAEQ